MINEYWNYMEVACLRHLYPQGNMSQMMFILGKTKKAIESKAQRMKLKQDWRIRQATLIKVAYKRNDG